MRGDNSFYSNALIMHPIHFLFIITKGRHLPLATKGRPRQMEDASLNQTEVRSPYLSERSFFLFHSGETLGKDAPIIGSFLPFFIDIFYGHRKRGTTRRLVISFWFFHSL